MEKPFKQNKEYYCFYDAMNYLQEKYKITDLERDHFWCWLCTNEINNGSFFLFSQEYLDDEDECDIYDSDKKIYQLILDEFGNHYEIEMEIWW